MGKYDDIIDREHPTSTKYPRMSRENRAAQFAPFAALSGYEDAVDETARLTERRQEMTEEQLARVNRVLHAIYTHHDSTTSFEVTYFVPDVRKAGGSYVTRSGTVRDVNPATETLTLFDRTEIPFSDILSIRPETKEK